MEAWKAPPGCRVSSPRLPDPAHLCSQPLCHQAGCRTRVQICRQPAKRRLNAASSSNVLFALVKLGHQCGERRVPATPGSPSQPGGAASGCTRTSTSTSKGCWSLLPLQILEWEGEMAVSSQMIGSSFNILSNHGRCDHSSPRTRLQSPTNICLSWGTHLHL